MPFTGFYTVSTTKLNDYGGHGNSDERYFYDCIFEEMVISKTFKIYTRDKLDKSLKELKLQMKDLFDPDTAKRVGKFVGADLIVLIEGYIGEGRQYHHDDEFYKGGIFRRGGLFRVKVIAIDVETAEVKGTWKKYTIGQ